MAVEPIRYSAPGWGVGEVWLDGDVVLWHELPHVGASVEREHDSPLVTRLAAYFAGEPVSFDDVEVDLEELTPFHRALTAALRRVPRGEVVSYGELAALAGRPGAQRAAGTFCAQNRLPLIVPCHRVVGASGPGSYGALGLEYKRRLLALEGVTV